MVLSVATALALLSVAAASSAPAESPKPAFSSAEYFELIRRYASGERTAAVAALGAWSERDLVRQLAAVEAAARALERCPSCPNSLEGVSLEAAVLLHWDRDRAEQPPSEGVEQPRHCPGLFAQHAGRLARVLARRPATQDFAVRFFRMVALSCQWDACFEASRQWAGEAIELFPKDAALRLARGSANEESATLGVRFSPELSTSAVNQEVLAETVQRDGLEKARRDFEAALALDPEQAIARVRLGRVLWRLGDSEPARAQLETALASLQNPDHLYLAHLYLGRVHQDAGRLEQAIAEYRSAVALHPSALSGGVALSNALGLAGDAEGARLALQRGLQSAGRRRARDPHWDYLVVNAADLRALEEALHEGPLE